MPVPLPVLDDRRWTDLVDEGRSLIPLYAPDWTDHNIHDPGVTLVELLAWIAEMDIYRLNRIPDVHRRRFLQLVGVTPRPPVAARAAVAIRIDGDPPVSLPAGTELAGTDASGTATVFRSVGDVTLVAGRLHAIQYEASEQFTDLTGLFGRGAPVELFGVEPAEGAAIYAGFSDPLPIGVPISLYLHTGRPAADRAERGRIHDEARARQASCDPRPDRCGEHGAAPPALAPPPARGQRHHSVRLEWECLTQAGGRPKWVPLTVEDDTRALTLDGSVHLIVTRAMTPAVLGRVPAALHYVRARLVSGAYDATPRATGLELNAFAVEQARPLTESWTVAPDAHVTGSPPPPGTRGSMDLTLDAAGRIASLTFPSPDPQAPELRVIEYTAPAGAVAGRLVLEAVRLGEGTGAPHHAVALPEFPVPADGVALHTIEELAWHRWRAVDDFTSSRGGDRHYAVDRTTGVVSFGDGRRGYVPPAGALIVATGDTTRAEQGNVAARTIRTLRASPHNLATIPGFAALAARIASIANAAAAEGGDAAETLQHAMGRAVELREARLRAVTAEDFDALARETPGVTLARVGVRPNYYPGMPGIHATGTVTVLLIPWLPRARPSPSAGLRRSVSAYLARRRIIGTRIEVVGPEYLELQVIARVRALSGRQAHALRQAIVDALNLFLDPLRGGPEGTGWPFGRDVYRAEILQAIDRVPGVDHVVALSLVAGGGDPVCGNVCVGPTTLIAPAHHQVTVV